MMIKSFQKTEKYDTRNLKETNISPGEASVEDD